MADWFECKVKYDKLDEYGKDQTVSESYVIDAVSFTEAESRLVKLLETEITSNFIVAGISKLKVSEIVPSDGADYWYKTKVAFVDIDEKSGKEKKTINQILVAANDFKQSLENLEKNLETLLIPYEITAINSTKIIDVVPYDAVEYEIESRNLTKLDPEDERYIAE